MKISVALVLALGIGATPLAAQSPASTAPSSDKADKKICRSSTATGSIMPGKRVCHSVQEWAQIDAAEEAANANFRDRAGNNAIPR